MILFNRIHSFRYLRSTSLGCKEIRKSEFVAKTQFLNCNQLIFNILFDTAHFKTYQNIEDKLYNFKSISQIVMLNIIYTIFINTSIIIDKTLCACFKLIF